ncbi:hypothetical protein HAX54_034090, partial [Datura stramonium]|nr:hypothetical protein [Datura stramonium]
GEAPNTAARPEARGTKMSSQKMHEAPFLLPDEAHEAARLRLDGMCGGKDNNFSLILRMTLRVEARTSEGPRMVRVTKEICRVELHDTSMDFQTFSVSSAPPR